MTTDTHRFGMFAKYWQPGKVKTRLAAAIGEKAAADVYRAFLQTSLERFGDIPHPLLVYSPDDQEPAFRDLVRPHGDQWKISPQGDGDLGQRMHRFFHTAFAAGFPRATLIGSDTPSLPTSYILQSAALLRRFDVVLGPSEDGGYYLIGAREKSPPIFAEISWSSPNVWQQTIQRLQEYRIRFAVLPTWYDVDTLADLNRLRRERVSPSLDSLQNQLNSILDS